MPLTPAERAKKYRDSIKANPDKHREYLEKERKRYIKRKAEGQYDTTNRTEREKRNDRRHWRHIKRIERERKKNVEKGTVFMTSNSPPSSGNEENESNAMRGRKKVRKERAKAYRKIRKLEKELEKKEKSVEKYRTRWMRIKLERGKTKITAKNRSDSTANENILNVDMLKEIRAKYRKQKTERARYSVAKLVPQQLLRKYRLTKKYSKQTGISLHRLKKSSNDDILNYEKKTGSFVWRINMKRKIEQFLKRDINTTMAPGKKDTKTKGKIKKQKRYLNDTLLNLHQKFLEENQGESLSYSSFCRMKPFYVVNMNVCERNTCLCTLHENVKLRVQKLHQLGLLDTRSPEKAAELLVCDLSRVQCTYNECNRCKNFKLIDTERDDFGKQVIIQQWVRRTEEINKTDKDGKKIIVSKTVKDEVQSSIEILVQETRDLMKHKFCKHVYNIRHQHTSLKTLKDSLSGNEVVIHVDFSENYSCKLTNEIQSMHFGGARNQVTLHTIVVYAKDSTKSYCTISDEMHHGPAAIWGHLDPILKDVSSGMPNVTHVHFVSDGPTTQYRSKKSFFLFNSLIHQKYGFLVSTWNFTEAGHGKSAADGVGGVVKRTADRLVSNGQDIIDAESFFFKVPPCINNVKFFYIQKEAIAAITLPDILKTVKGTMMLHQIISRHDVVGTIKTKSLSCFCRWPQDCSCFQHGIHTFTHSMQDNVGQLSTTRNEREANTAATNENPTGHDVEPISPDPELIGKWCMVKYDGNLFPGHIQDLDNDSAEVNCMHSIGKNRYFWPRMVDCIWYKWDDIVCIIEEPTKVTARHKQIDPILFEKLSNLYDL